MERGKWRKAGVAGLVILMMCGSAWADPVVPDVVGMTEADANGAITAVDNLTVGIVAYDYNDIMAAGLVVSQDPLAGTEVPIGSSIDLVVSLGQPVVPDVVGQMEADANMAIVSVDNLHIGDITYEYNEIVAAGCVIGQSPVGGTAVPIGSPVDVVVSLGQPVVPDVVGQTEADANMAIVSVDNLYIGEITYEYSEIVAAGLVISQSPVGGTPVPIGSPIDLVVSLGAPDPNSLVAHWEFDEGAGTTAYDSAGDNDGTLVNGPTWTTGVLDGALDFDGVDDYVNVGQPESLQNMGKGSIVLWFKPDVTIDNTLDTYLSLFEKNRYGAAYDGDTTLAFTRHSGDQGRLSIDITNDTGGQFIVYSDNSLWPGGAWQHVAATWDNATGVIRMFINGVEQIDRIDDFTGITMSAARDVTMGGNSEKTMYWWEGAIDEVRVYNRALSAEEIQHLYEQGLPGVFYVDGVNGSDLNDGLTLETAFATIQKGIDEANDGNTVLVYPAVYGEAGEGVDFKGKAIMVQGVATEAGIAVIDCPANYAVSFYTGEDANSILKNFVIRNSFNAVFIVGASPTISNLTVVDNEFGIAAYAGAEPNISSCIFYNNIEGDLYDCQAEYSWVEQDFNEPNEPMFGDANNGDYHLLSERGRYWGEHDVWVFDEVTSPCVDGGDPAAYPADERMPNGGRINMGAYGGTVYASMSEMSIRGDISWDGIVNMKDLAILAADWLEREEWLQ